LLKELHAIVAQTNWPKCSSIPLPKEPVATQELLLRDEKSRQQTKRVDSRYPPGLVLLGQTAV
jgi:hypothetical protein